MFDGGGVIDRKLFHQLFWTNETRINVVGEYEEERAYEIPQRLYVKQMRIKKREGKQIYFWNFMSNCNQIFLQTREHLKLYKKVSTEYRKFLKLEIWRIRTENIYKEHFAVDTIWNYKNPENSN